MSLQDLVGNAGCDATQSRNPIAAFAEGLTDAKGNEFARHVDPLSESSSSRQSIDDMNPALYDPTESLDDASDELDRFLGNLHIDPNLEGDPYEFFDPSNIHLPGAMQPSDDFYHEFMNTIQPKYRFVPDNLFMNDPLAFDHGTQLFREGRLVEAIAAFEAVVTREPTNSDAWRWLGTSQAENDEDKQALLALKKSLEADGENIEALLDAGVSYTNELSEGEALAHLRAWLRLHPEYASIVGVGEMERPLRHKDVTEMFIAASQIEPNDVDVWTVLGVLFNLSRDFERAEDAFKRAIALDPENYSLWNKLGATQANSPRSDGSKQAVAAYRKALELKPNYVRAWVNMGISFANQGLYDIAAKYYLRALSLNPVADHIWSYLRLSLTCMRRDDLVHLVSHRNIEAFRAEFKF